MISVLIFAICASVMIHQYFVIRELKREKRILETDLYAARGDIKKSQSMLEKEWRLLSTEKSRRNTPVTDSGTLTDTSSSSKKKKEKQKDKFGSSSRSSSIWHSSIDDYSISSGLPSSSSSSSSSRSSSSSDSSDSYSGGGGSFSGSGSGGSWSDSSSSSSSGGFD